MMERKCENYWKLISFAIVGINVCTYNQHLICPPKKKIDQETNSLRHIKDGFPKIVIVGGLTPSHVNTDGISIINIIDFLKDTEGNLL